MPTHQVRHICKAHKADTQKPTLQKSLPCANTQAALCDWTQSHIVDNRGEGRTYNRGFAKIRADGSHLQLFVILLCLISGRRFSIQLLFVIFIISFSIIFGTGRTEYLFPYFGKPCPLCVTLLKHFVHI